jgi:threonine/homoserine/homoserine lactone efflux protein
MPDFQTLVLFLVSTLVLLITPGPAVLFILTTTLQHGRTAGFASILGLCCGGLVHVIAAVFGLSAILSTSAVAFHVVKLLGAAYLIFLGVKALTTRQDPSQTGPADGSKSLRRLFVDGLVVNIFNPKAAIFFLAFLPQFVNPGSESVQAQLAFLGLLFISFALITDSAYALLASSLHKWLARSKYALRFQRYFTATVYLGLGITAAMAGGGKK